MISSYKQTYARHSSLHVVLFYNLVYIYRWQYHIYHLDSCLGYNSTHSYRYQDNNGCQDNWLGMVYCRYYPTNLCNIL